MTSFKLYKNGLTLNKNNPSQSFILTHRKYVAVSVFAEIFPLPVLCYYFAGFGRFLGVTNSE